MSYKKKQIQHGPYSGGMDKLIQILIGKISFAAFNITVYITMLYLDETGSLINCEFQSH
ncbi:hypothetical protein KM92CIT3_200422 [uncultured Citrobacter sp.]|uniref:Uncharacterized protein n=1 Tax=uncultured Citrobacter sp. TaxID=200446 RepID=A0A212I841_9ENTR|nr:hypothetical protein KM92CIT3_200422 [uncultured Citrobacter sp.]SBV67507.1 hypothetical protein KL86CIT2_540055 [uncultured Citrobacter sp.]